MTTPTNPAGEPEPMTLAEIRALLEQTARASAENTAGITEMRTAIGEIRIATAENARGIAEMRAANAERDARHDKEMAEIRAAQSRTEKAVAENTSAIAEMSAAIADLTQAQYRTNQEVSTLKGWGLELYCERNPEIFAVALGLDDEELVPKREIRRIAGEAMQAGVITPDQRRNVGRADIFIYARRESDHQPFCLVVEASYQVDDDDVDRAVDRAEIMGIILNKYQPRHLNGQVMPIVAGTDITPGAWSKLQHFGVTYVPVNNGNQLTNPSE